MRFAIRARKRPKNPQKLGFSDPDRVESGPGFFFETVQDFFCPGELDQTDLFLTVNLRQPSPLVDQVQDYFVIPLVDQHLPNGLDNAFVSVHALMHLPKARRPRREVGIEMADRLKGFNGHESPIPATRRPRIVRAGRAGVVGTGRARIERRRRAVVGVRRRRGQPGHGLEGRHDHVGCGQLLPSRCLRTIVRVASRVIERVVVDRRVMHGRRVIRLQELAEKHPVRETSQRVVKVNGLGPKDVKLAGPLRGDRLGLPGRTSLPVPPNPAEHGESRGAFGRESKRRLLHGDVGRNSSESGNRVAGILGTVPNRRDQMLHGNWPSRCFGSNLGVVREGVFVVVGDEERDDRVRRGPARFQGRQRPRFGRFSRPWQEEVGDVSLAGIGVFQKLPEFEKFAIDAAGDVTFHGCTS